ncbi:MAG: DUF4316 domain-containing protein [Lachnospiraceae bacterium]|nr:DUF4316 domain-containing protein [Lachnospiraceae bacterium]
MGQEKTYGVWAVRSGAAIFGAAATWCKEDGKPLEFDTQKAAEDYAREMNGRTTANVHYCAREKEPEPGAVKRRAAKPNLGALSHDPATPRDEAAEKLNEIPGRQLMPDQEPVVLIRAASLSNYAGMVAMVGTDDRVYLGREERYHYRDVPRAYYDNGDGSLCLASEREDMFFFLCSEGWIYSQEKMLEHGLTMGQYEEFARMREGVLSQFTARREVTFDGQPFRPPEDYLRNAELHEEGQTGNYNMLDGRLDNGAPERPDLTDGQTWEEVKELAPGSLAEEKPSLVERLKADRPEHEARQAAPPGLGRER